jgi:hypothetical protein
VRGVPAQVPREEATSAARFFDVFYASCSPVVLTGLVERAFRLPSWSPAGLRDRFGDVDVQVTTDRENDERYATTFRRRAKTMSVRALAEHVAASADAPNNDVYLVPENKVFATTRLRELLREVAFPTGWLDVERLHGGEAALWFGPAGTKTPLHHDLMNVLACQLHGRKRWRLVAPTETSLLEQVDRGQTLIDVGELTDALVKEVVLEQGEALFVPAGWWHQVESLAPSTTLSLTSFPRPNKFVLRDQTRR